MKSRLNKRFWSASPSLFFIGRLLRSRLHATGQKPDGQGTLEHLIVIQGLLFADALNVRQPMGWDTDLKMTSLFSGGCWHGGEVMEQRECIQSRICRQEFSQILSWHNLRIQRAT